MRYDDDKRTDDDAELPEGAVDELLDEPEDDEADPAIAEEETKDDRWE